MGNPIDRTAKAELDLNLVNGVTSDAPKLKANNDVLYDYVDYLNSQQEQHAMASVLPHPDGSVTTAKIANSAITSAKIANNAVETAKIVDNAVTSAKIADQAVTETKIAEGAVTREKISSLAITQDKIANGAVTASKLAADVRANETINNALIRSLEGDVEQRGLNVRTFGAIGDGIVDDTAAIELAATKAAEYGALLFIPYGTYRIKRPLNLRYVRYIYCLGTLSLEFDDQEYGILIGNSSGSSTPVNIYIANVTTPESDPVMPSVRIVGLKNGRVTIQKAEYVQLWADTDSVTTSSIAYSTFEMNDVRKLELATNPNPIGSEIQWINENSFYCGRVNYIVVKGTYPHNNNRFIRPAIENGAITFEVGHSNVVEGIRAEGEVAITFGPNTHNNMVTRQWVSIWNRLGDTFGDPTFDITIHDNGAFNYVIAEQGDVWETFEIFRVDKNTPGINGAASLPIGGGNFSRFIPGFEKVTLGAFRDIFWSDFIEVTDDFMIEMRSDAVFFRVYIYLYNENKELITVMPDPFPIGSTSMNWVEVNGVPCYAHQTNVNSSRISIRKTPNVKYIKIRAHSYVNVFIKFFSCVIKGHNVRNIFRQINQQPSPLIASGGITQGYFPKGYIIPKESGGYHQCTFALKTSLAADASATSNAIEVNDATGVSSGDVIGILLDDGSTHWTIVNGTPTGNTITLTTALTGAAKTGNIVGFNRWT